MIGTCRSAVPTDKTPTGGEIGDRPTAGTSKTGNGDEVSGRPTTRTGKTGTGSNRRAVLPSIFP